MASWHDIAVPVAAGLEGAAVLSAIRGDDVVALATHVASCGCIVLGLHRRLVEGTAGASLVFGIALFLPVLGAAGLVATALVAPPAAVSREPDLVRTRIPGPAEAPAAAPPLTPIGALPASARVAAARGRSDPSSIALLRRALQDPEEDVRLVAFALLESKSRAAYRSIHDATRELEAAAPARRGAIHRRVAAEHWELAWLGLAQGECLDHALTMARHHARAALDEERGPASLHLLLGRVELRRGETEDAEAALLQAMQLGLPATIARPYLAEAAFLRRRFDLVRRRLAEAMPARGNPAVDRIRRYWS